MGAIKHGADLAAAGAAFTALLHAIPQSAAALASILSVVWYILRLIDWYKGKRHDS